MADHCLANCGWDRRAITVLVHSVTGTVSNTTPVSRGEISNIITRLPTSPSTEASSRDDTCCTVCDRLSMSLVALDSTSPRGRVSK